MPLGWCNWKCVLFYVRYEHISGPWTWIRIFPSGFFANESLNLIALIHFIGKCAYDWQRTFQNTNNKNNRGLAQLKIALRHWTWKPTTFPTDVAEKRFLITRQGCSLAKLQFVALSNDLFSEIWKTIFQHLHHWHTLQNKNWLFLTQ